MLRQRGLAVMRDALDAPSARGMLGVLYLVSDEMPDAGKVAESLARLWEELAVETEPLLPDAWQSRMVSAILDSENPFSLCAEKEDVPPVLMEQVRRDLRSLKLLFDLDSETLFEMVERTVPSLGGMWVPWRDPGRCDDGSPRCAVASALAASEDWGKCAELLAEHFRRHGAGRFGRFRAFRWEKGALKPIPNPDPVSFRDLIGYENERAPIIANTKRFIEGLPAHHALLYGLPGTGKSSTVKAVSNETAKEGLRLIEVAKEDLGELPMVLDTLRERGLRFVVFVDDLSFEENEVEYKSLKALLEGSVESPPENVRIYATSNRRNLIRESFSERGDGDDVHARDTMHEKLSLAARFGLRVTFPTPDQERYLEIVRGLVKERGIEAPEEELVEKALLWDKWQSGRSGRTARQFVDELQAGG
ncbi:MAG: ATP-binding protein [Rubrobacter sp.]|nr:ATP-binding protein [Rubrobacter sp.]